MEGSGSWREPFSPGVEGLKNRLAYQKGKQSLAVRSRNQVGKSKSRRAKRAISPTPGSRRIRVLDPGKG